MEKINEAWKVASEEMYKATEEEKAASGADVIFSDKVISMSDRVNKVKKLNYFKKFKIDKKLMGITKKDCIFLHCLPRGKEVDEKIFLSKEFI